MEDGLVATVIFFAVANPLIAGALAILLVLLGGLLIFLKGEAPMRFLRPLIGMLLLSACTLKAPAVSSTRQSPQRPGTEVGTSASDSKVEVSQRTCETAIYSQPHKEGAWREGELVRFLDPESSLPSASDDHFVPDDAGEYEVFKLVLVVNGRASAPIHLRVGGDDGSWAGLSYGDGETFRAVRLSPTEVAGVTLIEACAEQDTQYNGGVVASRPGCIHVTATAGGQRQNLVLAYGVSACEGTAAQRHHPSREVRSRSASREHRLQPAESL